MNDINASTWPTMVTPFTDEGEVDYSALADLIEWYIENGADGLFSICQSSEVFYLSLDERIKISRFVKEYAANRVPVIASGHTAYSLQDQIKELNMIAETGVDAVILISNRLAARDESDDVLLDRLDRLVNAMPKELPLGFYECPYPYKRLLTPKVIDYCTKAGRFAFLKDTCCDIDMIRMRLNLMKGSKMMLYNANTSTLLESLKAGAAGYSGVMANFQLKLYSWLVKNWRKDIEKAQNIQDVLTVCSFIELKNYPANAKKYLSMNGVKMIDKVRKESTNPLSNTEIMELEQLRSITVDLENKINIL